MPLYICEMCKFSTKLKTDNKRHLLTNKHKRNLEETALKTQKDPKKTQKDPKKTQKDPKRPNTNLEFHCEYCEKQFSSFAHKRRHELHRCKETDTLKNQINIISNKYEKEKKQLYKQIEKLIDKAGNTTNIQANTQNTQNIKLNSYGKEDLSHITDTFKTDLLKLPYGMIPKMIEAVHFNDNKPENKNIQFTNIRDNKLKVFSEDKWIHKGKEETINDLMDGKYFVLDSHYKKMIENSSDPIILNFYKKFRKLFDERDKMLIEDQKKECELVLLNNR